MKCILISTLLSLFLVKYFIFMLNEKYVSTARKKVLLTFGVHTYNNWKWGESVTLTRSGLHFLHTKHKGMIVCRNTL